MPLKVVGETGVTIQLGGLRTKDKVLVRCGLLQQVLIGIDFLTVHKCLLILTLTTYTEHCYGISKYGRRHTL